MGDAEQGLKVMILIIILIIIIAIAIWVFGILNTFQSIRQWILDRLL